MLQENIIERIEKELKMNPEEPLPFDKFNSILQKLSKDKTPIENSVVEHIYREMELNDSPSIRAFTDFYYRFMRHYDRKVELLTLAQDQIDQVIYEATEKAKTEYLPTISSVGVWQVAFRPILLQHLDSEPNYRFTSKGSFVREYEQSVFEYGDVIMTVINPDQTLALRIWPRGRIHPMFNVYIEPSFFSSSERKEILFYAVGEDDDSVRILIEGQCFQNKSEYYEVLSKKLILQKEQLPHLIRITNLIKSELMKLDFGELSEYPIAGFLTDLRDIPVLETRWNQYTTRVNLRTLHDPKLVLNASGKREWRPWVQLAYFLCIIQFLITMIINLSRPAFFSLMMSTSFIIWFKSVTKEDNMIHPVIFFQIFFCAFLSEILMQFLGKTQDWNSRYQPVPLHYKNLEKVISHLGYFQMFLSACITFCFSMLVKKGWTQRKIREA